MNISISNYDVTLRFAHNKEVDGANVAEEQVAITVSPQQFKAIAIVLANTLKGYESAFGDLKLPPGFAERSDIAELLQSAIGATPTSSSEPPQPSKRSRGAARKKDA